MGVPKRRTSKMKKRSRKASHRQSPVEVRVDKKTGSKHLSHRVDPETGMYRGKQILSIKSEE